MSKKILYLIPRFTTGGAEKMVGQYAHYFAQANYEVVVASVLGGGELAQTFADQGITTFVSPNKTLTSWRALKKFVAEFQPGIIHSHVFSGDLAGYLLTRKNKPVKWISTQHNVGVGTAGWKKLIWRFILRSADQVVAVSPTVFAYCAQELKIPTTKLQLIKNGINLAEWEKVELVLSLPKGQTRTLQLATIGRLESQKGHWYLLQALAELKNEDWCWQVFGTGTEEIKLKKIATKLGIANKIIWHGVCQNIVAKLAAVDVVIQPSLWEGLSLVVMEAMAAGRVVVASAPAAEGLIVDQQNGLVVKPADVLSLVDTIKYCLTHQSELIKLAEQARVTAWKDFDWQKNIAMVEKLYTQLS